VGRIDVLVNNAGVGQRALATDTLLDVDRQLMELDYFAPIALTKLVLPQMIERKSGTLVVTSSVAGKYGVPLRSAYCAAKHALHGYFDTLRIELLKYNIDVSLLVIAGVTSEVSYKALTADGSPFGDFDYGQNQGITPLDCAQTVLDGLINKDEEIVIGKGRPIEALWLKRYAPETITERFSRIPLPDDVS
jgi:short-subunit dehydrogenase